MPKDYANKNRVNHRYHSRKEQRSVSPLLAALAAACFLGALAVYGVHMYKHSALLAKERINTWLEGARKIIVHNKNNIVLQTTPVSDEIQFDFYHELPNMQVNLPAPDQQTKPFSIVARKQIEKAPQYANLAGQIDASIQSVLSSDITLKEQKPAKQFIVQVAEFNNQLNASQLRLSLLLAGIETEIVKAAESKYRVQKGPFPSERQAKAVQRQLINKGFEGTIKNLN